MMSKQHVLYLEDDSHIGELTTEMLQKAGFIVVWANDGKEGLNKFKEQQFDICIIDIMMPKLDGYTLVKTIRATNIFIPIIFLSARVLTEDIIKGFEIGGDDYVRKPFSVEELIVRMKRLLNKNSIESYEAKIVNIGKYILNFERLELKIGDQITELSPRAGELLYRMATAKNRILSRRETLLDLWGDDNFFNSRSLDVFISKIRKCLSADGSIKIINIRAMGYKLIIE